uniref:Uncharacterized protein LOC123613198 n=1 Tax=Camelus bactrianus TaxID=9837 RepID=A0A9W3FN42_CAMBA|nr:uncharacterized protein LOC123613198 [Camelus bactrianus]
MKNWKTENNGSGSKRRPPKTKIGLKPLALTRRSSVKKTHNLPPPPVTNSTVGRKATDRGGLRPAPLRTRGPGSRSSAHLERKEAASASPGLHFVSSPPPPAALTRTTSLRGRSPSSAVYYPRSRAEPAATVKCPSLLLLPLRGLRRLLARVGTLRGSESCGRVRRTPPRGGALTAATVEGLPPGRQRGAIGPLNSLFSSTLYVKRNDCTILLSYQLDLVEVTFLQYPQTWQGWFRFWQIIASSPPNTDNISRATFIVRERREREALLVDVTWFMKPSPRSEAAEQTLRRIISCFNLLLDRN